MDPAIAKASSVCFATLASLASHAAQASAVEAPATKPLTKPSQAWQEMNAAARQIVIRPGTLSHQMLTAAYQAEGLSLVPDMDFDGFQRGDPIDGEQPAIVGSQVELPAFFVVVTAWK